MCICYNKSYLNEDWCKIGILLIIVWSEVKYDRKSTNKSRFCHRKMVSTKLRKVTNLFQPHFYGEKWTEYIAKLFFRYT